ncbi:MAG TPA: HEAT repeat domain-containing protein [Gemmataceae bacterium]|nr:HEAT repeat domain-containing protein [Gemmataceae bacterium]
MRRYLLGWIVCVLLPAGIHAAESTADVDVSTLKAAGIPTDGPGLANYFKKRTVTVAKQSRIKELVRQLGDDDFKKREEASRQLVMFGSRARPFLQSALKDANAEIVRRAQDCLERIEQGTSSSTLSAAVRVLARRRPSNAVSVLLNYLPSAEDERVAETIHQVLPDLALRDGKAEATMVEALTDDSAVKRAAAGAALAGLLLPDVIPRVRKLLHDHDSQVCLRVGLALAAHGEKDAVPVLIRLIDDVPLERNGLVLELLDRLAAGTPPPGMPVTDQEARHKCRLAWETWWKEHQDKIEPARLKEGSRSLGFTLIVLLDLNTIEFIDRSEAVRWKIANAQQPLDAQLLPGEQRVLLAEYQADRITERNLKGEIVWKKKVGGPLMAQRLANGNTFIAMRNRLIEIDKDGKEVLSYSRPDGGDFMRAAKLPDGDIACIVQFGGALTRYVRLTPAGKDFKEIKNWGVQVRTSGGRVEVLPNGHVLIPEMDNNRVVEYDADGQNVWETALDQPIAAVRLPNGNTIVTLMRENRAVEVDRTGKEVWQFRADSRVTRAFRR